jgi:DNA-binding NtrC family response regulator
MKLLIIEDEHSLGPLLAELLIRIDAKFGKSAITNVTVVKDLETAMAKMPMFDAVLCDGEFPTIPESVRAMENWPIVASHALSLGIPVLIYSGSPETLLTAVQCGLPALAKPAPIERIYDALLNAKPMRAMYGVGGDLAERAGTRDSGHGARDSGEATREIAITDACVYHKEEERMKCE